MGLVGSAMAEPQLEKAEIRYQGWAGQVTFVELADDLGYLAPLKLKWIGNTISGPQDIQTVVTGDIDIGGAFYGAIIKLIAADKRRSRRMKAIAALSTLVGAVSMARAVNDEKLSREILKSAADELKAQLG